MQATSNNSSNTIIDLTSNEIYYKFKIANAISLLLIALDLSKKVFSKLRLAKREKVDNAIAFINIFIKTRYDLRYLLLNLKIEDKVFLKLYYRYSILKLKNRKLA